MPYRTASRAFSKIRNTYRRFSRLKKKRSELWLNHGFMSRISRTAPITGLIHGRYPDASTSMVSSDHSVNFTQSFPGIFTQKHSKPKQDDNTEAERFCFFLYMERDFCLFVCFSPCSNNLTQTDFWNIRISHLYD